MFLKSLFGSCASSAMVMVFTGACISSDLRPEPSPTPLAITVSDTNRLFSMEIPSSWRGGRISEPGGKSLMVRQALEGSDTLAQGVLLFVAGFPARDGVLEPSVAVTVEPAHAGGLESFVDASLDRTREAFVSFSLINRINRYFADDDQPSILTEHTGGVSSAQEVRFLQRFLTQGNLIWTVACGGPAVDWGKHIGDCQRAVTTFSVLAAP